MIHNLHILICLTSLEENVERHAKFSGGCESFRDWLASEKEKLEECDDATGEKADMKQRLETLKVRTMFSFCTVSMKKYYCLFYRHI